MKVEIKTDERFTEPKVIICTDKITAEISEIVNKLSDAPPVILGFDGDAAEVLDPTDIVRVFSSDGKVFALCGQKEYRLRLRLYEAESRLDAKNFIRISSSEIINLKKVRRFDLRFPGTVCVQMTNGDVTYCSRRYVAKIKQILGI